ncbi:MAG: hypothetical protein KDH09_15070 [Chrysiogenetes bacterium]|nr:hypothetical protein [Chrysiogenetes bacterium]
MAPSRKALPLDFPESVTLLLHAGKLDAAREELAMLSRENPADPQWRYQLGRVLLAGDRPRYEEAIRHLSAAVQADPSRSNYHLWLARAFGIKLEHGAVAAAMTGAPLRLARHFAKAVQLDPENIPARADLFQFSLFAPAVLGGGEKRAARHLEKLRALAAGTLVFDQALAIEALHRGRMEEATNHLRAAGAKDESLAGHFEFQLGIIHMSEERRDAAGAHLARARELGGALEAPAQTLRSDFIRNIAFQKARVELERNVRVSVTPMGLGSTSKRREAVHPHTAALHEILSEIYEAGGDRSKAAHHRARAGLSRAA